MSPAEELPGRKSRAAVAQQRFEIGLLLRDSPSLLPELAETLSEVYRDAVGLAADATGIRTDAFASVCPLTADQVMNRAFMIEL